MKAMREQAQPFTPLPRYKAMLQLGGKWVTPNFCKCVEFDNTSPKMVDYVLRQLDITLNTFLKINWSAIGKVRQWYAIN